MHGDFSFVNHSKQYGNGKRPHLVNVDLRDCGYCHEVQMRYDRHIVGRVRILPAAEEALLHNAQSTQ
jgi:hypothetical protein